MEPIKFTVAYGVLSIVVPASLRLGGAGWPRRDSLVLLLLWASILLDEDAIGLNRYCRRRQRSRRRS